MVDKISELLFHPKSINKFKDIHLFKAILYIAVIAFISYLVPMIDTIRDEGYTVADQEDVETLLEVDFSIVDKLPNCQLENAVLSCDEPDQVTELGTGLRILNFVFDQNENYEIENNRFYVIFTKDSIKYGTQGSVINISYKYLPSEWESFDLETIKASPNPEEALFREFIAGFNQIIQHFIWLAVIMIAVVGYFAILFQTLFYSFMFYIVSRRYGYSFKEVFKVTTFAQTFPAIIGLIFMLTGLGTSTSLFVLILTFIYIYNALTPKTQIKDSNTDAE